MPRTDPRHRLPGEVCRVLTAAFAASRCLRRPAPPWSTTSTSSRPTPRPALPGTAITGAANAGELAVVARDLRPTVAALHDAQVAAEHITRDHLRRRRRARPSPHRPRVADEGIRSRRSRGWRSGHRPPRGRPELRCRLRDRLGRRRPRPADPRVHAPRRGARPRRPRRVRPAVRPEGRDRVAPPLRPLARRLGRAIDSWFEEPTQEKALILVSIVGDNRPVWGVLRAAPLAEHVKAAARGPGCCA